MGLVHLGIEDEGTVVWLNSLSKSLEPRVFLLNGHGCVLKVCTFVLFRVGYTQNASGLDHSTKLKTKTEFSND